MRRISTPKETPLSVIVVSKPRSTFGSFDEFRISCSRLSLVSRGIVFEGAFNFDVIVTTGLRILALFENEKAVDGSEESSFELIDNSGLFVFDKSILPSFEEIAWGVVSNGSVINWLLRLRLSESWD